jgi:hypothetical protein
MNLAIIENDKVVNLIVCDSLELAYELTNASEILDADEHNLGMHYTRENGVWVAPPPPSNID